MSEFLNEVMKTEQADIDHLLQNLGHGSGSEVQRLIVKKFRDQVLLLGAIEAIRVRKLK